MHHDVRIPPDGGRKMSYEMTYDMFQYITENGIALDDELNELRDCDGAIFVVPENDRHLFKVAGDVK